MWWLWSARVRTQNNAACSQMVECGMLFSECESTRRGWGGCEEGRRWLPKEERARVDEREKEKQEEKSIKATVPLS